MTLPHFDYTAPETLSEVFKHLDEHGTSARVMAGGTDLVLRLRERLDQPRLIISLGKIPQLRLIEFDEENGLTIGATALLSEVAENPVVAKKYRALVQGALSTATVQIRNVGTVIGNICNAAPCADNAPPLLVLDAEVLIESSHGKRILPLDQFFKGPGETALQANELVTAVFVPTPSAHSGSAYVPLSARSRVDMTAIGVGAALTLDGTICRKARIAVGAAAPIPLRIPKAEDLIVDRELSRELIEEASLCVAEEIRPISDIRASAAYRKAMATVLAQRALLNAHEAAQSRNGETH